MSSTRKEFHAPHIESTCVAALAYLQKTGIVTIDDANFAELKICKRKLQAVEFWSSTLYDKANALGNQLSLLTAAKQKPQPEDKQGATVLPPNHHNTPQTSQKVLSEVNDSTILSSLCVILQCLMLVSLNHCSSTACHWKGNHINPCHRQTIGTLHYIATPRRCKFLHSSVYHLTSHVMLSMLCVSYIR